MNSPEPSFPRTFITATLRLAVVAALILVGPAAAETAVQPTMMADTIDVRVVNVEAVVTDRSGVRIPGLTRDDFRLFVDGDEVPIGYFSEIVGGDVVDRSDSPAARSLAARLPEAGGLVPGEPLGTSYLVFVDEFFTIPSDRRRVLESLRSELDFLGMNDRMAVVAWDGSRVEMLSSWSQSPRELADVIEAAESRSSSGLHRMAEMRTFESTRGLLSDRYRYRPSIDRNRLDIEERAYHDLLYRQLEDAVTAAAASLRGFAMPPGRKVMMLLSGQWPDYPADYVTGNPLRVPIDFLSAGGDYLYGSLTDTANLLGYTVYPVDVHGIEGTAEVTSSAYRQSRFYRHRATYRELTVHDGLDHIARETGGVAILNGQRDSAFERVFNDTRSFYWIGFNPDLAGDDARHDVRLEVEVAKAKLRSRTGFVDLSRSSEATMAVESALLFGNPNAVGDLDVELGAARKAGYGKIEVPLTVEVPIEDLTLLESAEGWVGQLELRVAAMDSKGHRAPIPVIPIAVQKDEAPSAGETFTFETLIRMRNRDHEMVVALLDASSGEVFSTGAELVR